MRKKIIGILICMMLLITSALTTLIIPEKTHAEANPNGGEPEDGTGLDLDYIWNQLLTISNVTYTAYLPSDIPKGRSFGSKGGDKTANMLYYEMLTNLSLENVTTEQLNWINQQKNGYSSIINITDFQITVYTENGEPLYPFENPIPKKEMFFIPTKGKCDIFLTKNYAFDNTSIVPKDMTKLFPLAGTIDTNYLRVSNYDLLSENLSFIVGILTYIAPNDPVPNPDEQEDYVFLIDDINGVQEKLDNITAAEGVIIIDTDDEGIEYADVSNCTFLVAGIDNESGNEVKTLLENEAIIVDNIHNFGKDLTFTYNLDDEGWWPADSPFMLIDRIPNYFELSNMNWADHLFIKILALIGQPRTPTFMDYLLCVLLKAKFWRLVSFFHPWKPCEGIILYDSNDYHFMVSQNTDNRKWSACYRLPYITVNYSVGDFLYRNNATTTLSGYAKQKYLEETSQTPGAIGYNIYGNKTICKSPGDAIAIISNRYDGMWGQTPGDSGVGTAIVLGIAKYLNESLHENPSLKLKYNLTFLFTTAEEYGFKGAKFHCDNHSDQNITYWLMLDQLGFDQEDCKLCLDYRDPHDIPNLNKILEEIRKDSGYPENKILKRTGKEISDGSEQATVNGKIQNCTTFGLVKDQDRRWDHWHRAGNNYNEGDSVAYIDRDDVNATARLTWGLVKYFMINPDCWFNGSVTYTTADSPYDTDLNIDSINATFSVKTSLPIDKVRVRAMMKTDSNYTKFWKDFDFYATSEGTQKTITVTLPPTFIFKGDYHLFLQLFNSTGRIDEIVEVDSGTCNDTDLQTSWNNELYPRGNTNANKPSDIQGPETLQVLESGIFNSSAIDPNYDQLQFHWDWSLDTDRVGPYASGALCSKDHTYVSKGWKTINVKAREDYQGQLYDGGFGMDLFRYGSWGQWSNPYYIYVDPLIDFDVACTLAASAQSATQSVMLPSILDTDSIYEGFAFGGTAPYTYTWYFEDNFGLPLCQQTVAYQYGQTGIKTVTLNVTDYDDYSKEITANITVVNISASYNISLPSLYTLPGENITFNDTSAVLSSRCIENWTWDFDDGTVCYERNASHSYYYPGLYNATLTVTDDELEIDTYAKTIIIDYDDTPPMIKSIFNSPDETGYGINVSIVAVATDDISGIKTLCVNITKPDNTTANLTMTHVVNDTYYCVYNDTKQPGVYNYSIWIVDQANNTNCTSGFNFFVIVPLLTFESPTPSDNTIMNHDWVKINITVLDPLNTSAFIDWNHSLKGYWPMDSYNNTGVYDNSTFDNFGKFDGGMSTTNIKTGKYGKALEFDGYNDDVDLGTDSSLRLGTGNFTFMVWENSDQTSYTNKAVILTNRPADASGRGYCFGVQNKAYLYASAGSNVTLNGNADVTDHAWHHIAYVRKGTNYSIYVDGAYDAGVTGAMKNITNNQHACLSYGHWSNWAYFDGLLDEPQLYNRAFSREEINASYNNKFYRLFHNFTGLTEGTYLYYAHAIDTSGNRSQTEVRTVTIDFNPQITMVNASPHTVGFGFNVTISANVTDSGSGVNTVNVNVTYPNQTHGNYTMSHTTGNTYQYIFGTSWQNGQYNYTIWATDDNNNTASSSGHHFHVSATATISIATLKNSYSGTQYINITDPPNPPENLTLLGRGLTWNTYYNDSSGCNILESYQGPVNYQEDNSIWTPINNTISQLSSNHPGYVYGYRNGNDQGLYGVYFKSNAQLDWPVAFTYNRSDDPATYAVRSKLVGVGYVDPQSNWAYQYLQNAQSSQGQTNDNSITYPNVFTGTDVTWSYGNTGLKEEIALSNTTKTVLQNHPPSQYGLNDASSYLVFITKLDYQNLNIYNDSGLLDGNVTISDVGVEFRNVLGQFKCALPLGEAYELNNETVRQKLICRIVHLNGNTYLLSGLKVSKLNAMTFPVVIDPTLTVYSISNDGYIYYSGTNYNTVRNATSGTVNSSGAYITIGQRKQSGIPTSTYYVYRGFVFFNTSALPSNAYLDNATLSLYKKDDYSTTDFDITIQNGQPTYPHKPMQSGDYNKNYYSGNGGSLNTSRFTSGYNAIPLNNLNWINKTGITKLCLRSSRDISGTAPTGNEYVNVHSNEFLGMCPPKLVINYRNQSKIKNTGSTNIKGYLLIQVQYLDSGKSVAPRWVVDNDTVNETSPRTINTGNQLGLDTIFNGKIRASNLQHGTGTYRVYTAFRDPEGNILRTNTGVELKAWWQFSKT